MTAEEANGVFALGGAIIGIGGTLLGGWLRSRRERETRAEARRQARDDAQRQALQRLLNAALDWSVVLGALVYAEGTAPADRPGDLTHREMKARAEFMKVPPLVGEESVRVAAKGFMEAALQVARQPSVALNQRMWEAMNALTAEVDAELRRLRKGA